MKDQTLALKEWGKKTAKNILSEKPETKDRGFCVVTAVHLAESCQLSCWEKSTSSISGNVFGGSSGQGAKAKASSFAGAIHSGWVDRPVSTFLTNSED